jgi:hypothetical protein
MADITPESMWAFLIFMEDFNIPLTWLFNYTKEDSPFHNSSKITMASSTALEVNS